MKLFHMRTLFFKITWGEFDISSKKNEALASKKDASKHELGRESPSHLSPFNLDARGGNHELVEGPIRTRRSGLAMSRPIWEPIKRSINEKRGFFSDYGRKLLNTGFPRWLTRLPQ